MYDSKYHLNTVYMRPQQRLQQLPYQQLKAQLSRENYFNPLYVEKNPNNNQNNESQIEDTMSELKKLINDQSSTVDKKKLAHIHSIKLHPMVNENFISSFDQSEYKLGPEDKVKIVKQKVFRVQNYYNYLYELKCKQEYQKKNTQIMSYLKQSQESVIQSSIGNNNTSKLIKQRLFHQKSVRDSGQHMMKELSNNNNRKKYEEKDYIAESNNQERVLDPVYTKYEQKKRKIQQSQTYFLKEKDRRLVEQSAVGGRGSSSHININKRSYEYEERW